MFTMSSLIPCGTSSGDLAVSIRTRPPHLQNIASGARVIARFRDAPPTLCARARSAARTRAALLRHRLRENRPSVRDTDGRAASCSKKFCAESPKRPKSPTANGTNVQ